MKIITWNVNGMRAAWNKGLSEYLMAAGADIAALQETKADTPVPALTLNGYIANWNCGERPGYSGTVCLYKRKPLSVSHGFGIDLIKKGGSLRSNTPHFTL